MATKLIRKDQALEATPMRWPLAAGVQRTARVVVEAPVPSESAVEARLAELERQAELRVREAFQRGEAEGYQKARSEYEHALKQAIASAAEVANLKPRLRREAENDLVRLSIAIARRILGREMSVDPTALAGVIKAALEKLDASDVRRLRLHPSDAELIRKQPFFSGGNAGMEIAPDSTLPRGALILETTRGQWDASVESQLAEIERGFTDGERER